jgi:hypothetical protein
MKKRASGGTDERATRLLAHVAAEFNVRDVTAEWGDAPGGDPIFVVASAGGLSGVAAESSLALRRFAASLLHTFTLEARDQGFAETDLEALAEDRAYVVLSEFISRAPEAISDAIDLLFYETLCRAAMIVQAETDAEMDAALSRHTKREDVDRLSKVAAALLKRRLNARGRGAEKGVQLLSVEDAIMRLGGEDAGQKEVAAALGVSERHLRNIHDGLGMDWAAFLGDVVRRRQRK